MRKETRFYIIYSAIKITYIESFVSVPFFTPLTPPWMLQRKNNSISKEKFGHVVAQSQANSTTHDL